MNSTQKSWFFLALLLTTLTLYLAVCLIGLDDYLFLEFDSPIYITLSQALARGDGFVDISRPDSPPECSRYPLYPLFLLPAAVFFPLSVVAAKVVTALIALAALICFYFLLKKFVGRWWALSGTVCLAFNPFILFRYVLQPLGEYLYILIVLAFALWYFSTEERRLTRSNCLIAGLFFLGAALWKENGLALPLAYLIMRLRFRRVRKVDWFLVVLPVLVSAVWNIRNTILYQSSPIGWPSHLQEIGGRYFSASGGLDLSFLLNSLSHNGAYYLLALPRLVFSPFYLSGFMFGDCFPALPQARGAVLAAWVPALLFYLPVILGWKRFRPLPLRFFLTVWAAIYLTSILIFPASEVRMVFVLLPVFLLFFLRGLKTIAAFKGCFRTIVAALLTAFSLLLVGNSLVTAVLIPASYQEKPVIAGLARSLHFRPGQCRFRYPEAGEWIRRRTSPSATMAGDSASLFLFSGRQTVPLEALSEQGRGEGIGYAVMKSSFGLPLVGSRIRMNPWYDFLLQEDFGNVLVFAVTEKDPPGVDLEPDEKAYRSALDRARSELERYPDDPYLLHEIGMLYASLQEYREALGFLEAAFQSQPRVIVLTLDLASISILAGRYEEADALLTRAETQEVFQRSYERVGGLRELNSLYRELAGRMDLQGRKDLLLRIAVIENSLGHRVRAARKLLEVRSLDPADREIARILAEEFGVICGGEKQ